MAIVCLDDDQVRANLDTIRGKRGADFVYSYRHEEWMIACRDIDVKRRLRARYKAGLPIYALDEVVRVAQYGQEMADHVHEMVKRFGAEVDVPVQ